MDLLVSSPPVEISCGNLLAFWSLVEGSLSTGNQVEQLDGRGCEAEDEDYESERGQPHPGSVERDVFVDSRVDDEDRAQRA